MALSDSNPEAPADAGRFVLIDVELYDACADAWQHSTPDAGTCEWAGDVASRYEAAPVDAVETVRHQLELMYGYAQPHHAQSVLRALGYPWQP